MALSRLAWSVKQLLDSLPYENLKFPEGSLAAWFTRLRSHQADGCDFGLHHLLVCHLLEDNFAQAAQLVSFAGARKPRDVSTCLRYGSIAPQEEALVYETIFSINDLEECDLTLAPPAAQNAERVQHWIEQVPNYLKQACPAAYAELEAFQPVWLLAATKEGSKLSFGGYSSSLALGTIALNVELASFASVLIQVIHELAHQLLFALAAETPLVFNHPAENFPSPLRKDQRPMDGVLHASFVSARLLDALGQIEQSAIWHDLAETDQRMLQQERGHCLEAVTRSLPTIDAEAKLSALGERVVNTIRQAMPPA